MPEVSGFVTTTILNTKIAKLRDKYLTLVL